MSNLFLLVFSLFLVFFSYLILFLFVLLFLCFSQLAPPPSLALELARTFGSSGHWSMMWGFDLPPLVVCSFFAVVDPSAVVEL